MTARVEDSVASKAANSRRLSPSSRPLTAKTTSPFAVRSIFSIDCHYGLACNSWANGKLLISRGQTYPALARFRQLFAIDELLDSNLVINLRPSLAKAALIDA
jgi:hypothetical protein